MPSSRELRSCVYSVLTAYCAQHGGEQRMQKIKRVERQNP